MKECSLVIYRSLIAGTLSQKLRLDEYLVLDKKVGWRRTSLSLAQCPDYFAELQNHRPTAPHNPTLLSPILLKIHLLLVYEVLIGGRLPFRGSQDGATLKKVTPLISPGGGLMR